MTKLGTILMVLAVALPFSISDARAQASGASSQLAPPPGPFAIPKLEMEGPFASKIRLEVTNRIRGEFVDWFARPTSAPTRDEDYEFLGNRFQAGIRATRAPVERFGQQLRLRLRQHGDTEGRKQWLRVPHAPDARVRGDDPLVLAGYSSVECVPDGVTT